LIISQNDSYKTPVEGKTYISSPMKNSYGDEDKIRIVTRGIESPETYEVVKIKGEVLLRETRGGKNIITAKVFENSRQIHVLNIQQYTAETGTPHKLGFAFMGSEITRLFNFIKDIQTMQFGSQKFQQLSDENIQHIECVEHTNVSDKQAAKLFSENEELFSNVIRNEITKDDIVAVGYRKKQLEVFEKLLTNSSYFEDLKQQRNYTAEGLWQRFFEKNQWIFGYGLGYLFLTGLDEKKLEQVVQGYSVNNRGKRIDALMKTRGIISNLCFVEIKTHTTKLLASTPYRAECFSPSAELTGAISQVQGSVASATRSLSDKIAITDKEGNPTGEEIYNYQPHSFLVIGSLSEFESEHGINSEKLRSFELFRKNILCPEIITFDELFERARFITQHNENNNQSK
jgi:hypothetical protein